MEAIHHLARRHGAAEGLTAEGLVDLPAAEELETQLRAQGYVHLPALLTASACREIAALYASPDLFRSRVIMARHGFGQGEYQYFAYPLPPVIEALRHALYPSLAIIANRWQQDFGSDIRYPARLKDFLRQCHDAGQRRPTPLLLQYGPGDFNCLHQDVYGPLVFPLQIAILLSHPGQDFTGGEFVLTEQRPRQQSRASVVPLQQGDAVIFAVRERPVTGTRGIYRSQMRHGVSKLLSGRRHTLGLIFHDAA